MNTRKICILLLPVIFLLTNCEKKDDFSRKDYTPRFIVEGWIEDGEYPHVLLTHNVPFFTTLDSAQLNELIIRYAKITVSDGVKTEVLTTTTDNNYFPSFIYRGYELKGEAGKSYTLKIEYAGNTLTAQTHIPESVSVDSIWFSKRNEDKMQLILRFNDNPLSKDYYRIYTKTGSNKLFVPSLLSNQDDKFFNGKQVLLQINRGSDNNLTVKNEPYFERGDIVKVKFSSLPKEGYEFWSAIQDEVLNSVNPLVGSSGKIKSNIAGPGIGIWCGYGSKIYTVTAKD